MCCKWIIWDHVVDENSRRKGEMRLKEFSNLGGTAAYTIRGVKLTREFMNLPVDNFSIDEQKDVLIVTAGLAQSKQYLTLLKQVVMLSL